MDWVRGRSLGSGSFATVHLALPRDNSGPTQLFPSPAAAAAAVAVKTADLSTSSMLQNEESILRRLGPCPHIIKCLGHDSTVENGEQFYNLFLEYAAGGTIADQLKNRQDGKLPESLVRRHARSVLEGLSHIHNHGFVHCDIKLQNILVSEDGEAKIADFGLAKGKEEEEKQGNKRWECRGTPLFMSPESVNDNEYESPADVWALGCAVVEMATGKPAWNVKNGSNMWALLIRIGVGEELPVIPEELSEQGKDFLRKCFVKDPKKRWTAEMLLKHDFVSGDVDVAVPAKEVESILPPPSSSPSPRTNFDFPDWGSTVTVSSNSTPVSSLSPSLCLPADRVRRLATEPSDWSESDGWTSVR